MNDITAIGVTATMALRAGLLVCAPGTGMTPATAATSPRPHNAGAAPAAWAAHAFAPQRKRRAAETVASVNRGSP